MPPSLLVLRGHVQRSDARRSPDFHIRLGPGEVDDHGDIAGLSGKVQSSTTGHLLSNVGVPWRRILFDHKCEWLTHGRRPGVVVHGASRPILLDRNHWGYFVCGVRGVHHCTTTGKKNKKMRRNRGRSGYTTRYEK